MRQANPDASMQIDQTLLDQEDPSEIKIRDLQWSDLTYTVKKGTKHQKTILEDCFGHAKAGEVTAIIGESGAGKSTLLHILAQITNSSHGEISGRISLNGCQTSPEYIKGMSSYLRQEDVYHTFFSPNELLQFAAKLRVDGTNEERQEVINELLRDLKLEKCRNTRVGSFENKGLSGGEKRRISMALELLVNPGVLFMDEPTSGLDSFTALLVMGLLKQEAK